MLVKFALALSAASLAIAAPTAQTISGPFDCVPAGTFTLCQNLWGRAAGVGNQNSTLVSTSGNSVSWSTAYTWANGPNSVKSYANVESTTAKGCRFVSISKPGSPVELIHLPKLQSVQSAPTTWNWHYATQSDGIRADVAYDIWTGVPSSGNPASSASSFEIMIWLSGKGGIQPVGSQIQSNINVAGHTWNLWRGPNANWQVLSFVSTTGDITNFNVDLNDFFKYIIANQGVAPTQFVQSIQAGTEPFTGQANLITDSYSVAINH